MLLDKELDALSVNDSISMESKLDIAQLKTLSIPLNIPVLNLQLSPLNIASSASAVSVSVKFEHAVVIWRRGQ